MSSGDAIRVSGLIKTFGNVVAVKNLALNVARGEIFALVGPDGAGKTTLLRLMCGALHADSGSVFVDGMDAVRNPASVQAAIGYMPARFSLYPDLSVMENLRFYSAIFGVAAREGAARAAQLLEDFDLAPFVERRAEALSGGMKQKLALACALIHRPATILLDEPTAGVDPVSRRAFWKLLYRINRSGTTLLVSTPYLDEAERAGRVAFMARGTLLSCGTPAEIKSQFAGEVVEISAASRADVRRALHGASCVRSLEIFGESVHAIVESAQSAIPQLRERLRAAGIDAAFSRIDPSLEDAFVAKLAS